MRLRNIKDSKKKLSDSKYVIHSPEGKKGKWNEVFGNIQPIHLEIGMGKGQFLMQLAQNNPNINYIGIEKYDSILIRAVKTLDKPISNLLFLRFNAEYLMDIFDKGEISKIYLNFSDPWPKERHAKRRLTSKEFLNRYENVLRESGTIEFKTDNKELFEFSLEQIEETAWKLEAYTCDLHKDKVLSVGNIMTEYEEKFSKEGRTIHKFVLSH